MVGKNMKANRLGVRESSYLSTQAKSHCRPCGNDPVALLGEVLDDTGDLSESLFRVRRAGEVRI